MAADLTLAGYGVHLYETLGFGHDPRFARVLESKRIELKGVGRTGTAKIAMLTTNIAEALEGAMWLNVVVPAMAHDAFRGGFYPENKPSLRS